MSGSLSTQNLIIILTTTIPSAVFIVVTTVMCCRARRRKANLFERAITPVDDEEIQSWKLDRRPSEKLFENDGIRYQHPKAGSFCDHRPSISVGSVQKPASVIIYQVHSSYDMLSSEDGPRMPVTTPRQDSAELPSVPVLARAPNSRPGLTDEAIQGEDAFISQPKRQTMRLTKTPSSPQHGRSKSTRAMTSPNSLWQHGQTVNSRLLPRRSVDTFSPTTFASSEGTNSSFSMPRWGSFDQEMLLGGLSPRPLIHKSDIGRAIG